MTEREGSVVAGRYRLARPIGHGGMNTVWAAMSRCRDVAIKRFEPRESASHSPGTTARRIKRELLAAAKVPGTVAVYDAVTTDDELWLVMELVEGRSLASVSDPTLCTTPPKSIFEPGNRQTPSVHWKSGGRGRRKAARNAAIAPGKGIRCRSKRHEYQTSQDS